MIIRPYIERRFEELLACGFSNRLFGHSLRLAKTIRPNAIMLSAAMSERKGQKRNADTHATPLAGFLSLTSDELLTMDRARAVVEQENWVLAMAERNRADPDHQQALSHLMVQLIRLTPAVEKSVGDLIWDASQCDVQNRSTSQDKAPQAALRRHGIRVDPGGDAFGQGIVYFARSHAKLSMMFANTPWAARGWEGVIEQHPKVRRPGPVFFAPGAVNRALEFDMRDILGDRS